MAILNSTIVGGKLTVNGAISQNGALLSDTYAAKDHTHSQYLTSHQDISGKVDKTTAGVNTALNLLTTGSDNPVDNDYFISQYVNGGTSTTTYHRRPVVKLYNYIKGKLDSVYQPKGSYLTSHQSVSSPNNTATWGGAVTVGTVGGTDLKFTMPANPNTDHYAWSDITGKPSLAVLTSNNTFTASQTFYSDMYLDSNAAYGNTPSLVFKRGELTGAATDYKIYGSGGLLYCDYTETDDSWVNGLSFDKTDLFVKGNKVITNAGSNPTKGTGGAITQPGGEAVVSIRTTTGQNNDVGIFMLSQDNCYVANSSDNSYTFGVFDTDLTSDFSSTDTASFVVLSNGGGCKIQGSQVITRSDLTSTGGSATFYSVSCYWVISYIYDAATKYLTISGEITTGAEDDWRYGLVSDILSNCGLSGSVAQYFISGAITSMSASKDYGAFLRVEDWGYPVITCGRFYTTSGGYGNWKQVNNQGKILFSNLVIRLS